MEAPSRPTNTIVQAGKDKVLACPARKNAPFKLATELWRIMVFREQGAGPEARLPVASLTRN
jgi:hypothetical protein